MLRGPGGQDQHPQHAQRVVAQHGCLLPARHEPLIDHHGGGGVRPQDLQHGGRAARVADCFELHLAAVLDGDAQERSGGVQVAVGLPALHHQRSDHRGVARRLLHAHGGVGEEGQVNLERAAGSATRAVALGARFHQRGAGAEEGVGVGERPLGLDGGRRDQAGEVVGVLTRQLVPLQLLYHLHRQGLEAVGLLCACTLAWAAVRSPVLLLLVLLLLLLQRLLLLLLHPVFPRVIRTETHYPYYHSDAEVYHRCFTHVLQRSKVFRCVKHAVHPKI